MAPSIILYHGVPYGSPFDSCGYLRPGCRGYVLPTVMRRGSSLVVEILSQLCVFGILPLCVLPLVLVVKVGIGGSSPRGNLPNLHVDDFDCVRIDVWDSRILIVLLVHPKDLWGRQS